MDWKRNKKLGESSWIKAEVKEVRMAEIGAEHIHVSTLQIGSRRLPRDSSSGVSRIEDHVRISLAPKSSSPCNSNMLGK
jgi:hypothetical protein